MRGGIRVRGDVVEVNLKALGNFKFDGIAGKDSDIPAGFRGLDGKRVELVGYMYTDRYSQRAAHFEFVFNIALCCFGGPPKVQERVFVSTPPDHPMRIVRDMVKLTGKLHVKVDHDDGGNVRSVFTLDPERVERAHSFWW